MSLHPNGKHHDSRYEILELRIQHERELRELTEKNSRLELDKQAIEYERRLSDLNHAHERAVADKAEFLQKNLYEQSQKEFQKWKEETAIALSSAEAVRKEGQRMWGFIILGVSILINIITVILSRLV